MSSDAFKAVYDRQLEVTEARIQQAKQRFAESGSLLATARALHDQHAKDLQVLTTELAALKEDVKREFGS